MTPHSSTLAWKIPWTEEPGRLQSMRLLSVGHDWATSLSLFTFVHWRRKWQPTPVFLPGESQRLKEGREGDGREWDGWTASRLNGHEFEETLGVGDGQGGLVCCSPWGCTESDMTEQLNWLTEAKLFNVHRNIKVYIADKTDLTPFCICLVSTLICVCVYVYSLSICVFHLV